MAKEDKEEYKEVEEIGKETTSTTKGTKDPGVVSTPVTIALLQAFEAKIKDLTDTVREVRRTILYVVLIIIAMFIMAFFTLLSEAQKDEEVLMEYNDLHNTYSIESTVLNEKVNQQQIQINNLENVLRNLKTNHPWLKIPDF